MEKSARSFSDTVFVLTFSNGTQYTSSGRNFQTDIGGQIIMRLKLLACKVFSRAISYLCSQSENIVDITWIRQGEHNVPESLHALLQKEIDLIESGEDVHTNRINETGDFDAILLGYGLCSNATAGLTAKRHRIVIPKAHDCITMFLGSREAYAKYFHEIPGCYWYSPDWIENSCMPGEERHNGMIRIFEEQGYDEETIEYLMETMEGLQNYHNAAYIRMPYVNNDRYRKITEDAAQFYGWQYHELEGNMSLMERFINGVWDDEDFLVLEPGETAAPTSDRKIMKAVRRF